MIMFDRTTYGKGRAYQAVYNATTTYYGFFDAGTSDRYRHDGTTFVKDNGCDPSTSDGNCFPGNVLNYALMSTLDLARKAFIGFGWTKTSSSAGEAYTYTGDLTSYGASAARNLTVCNVSFAGGTYSYYFDIGNDGTGSTKASPLTITVNNTSTCPTSSVYWKRPVNNKDVSVAYSSTSDENRKGIIQRYADSNSDSIDDYPNAKARFGIKRWKTGGGNDKATEIINDSLSITSTNRSDLFKSLLNTASSSPSEDPGTPSLSTMMHDIVNYFRNNSTYKVTSSDANTFTQSPYNWANDTALACRKTFAIFITAGQGLGSDSDTHTGGALSTTCSSGTYSTDFSQNACYGYTTDLYTTGDTSGKTQNVRTYVVHTTSGITCSSGTSGSILHWLELSTTTQPDFAATGAQIFDLSAPAEKRAISIPWKEFSFKLSTGICFPKNSRVFPSDLSDAKSLSFSTGKFLCSRVPIISFPTAPVAPTTATTYFAFFLTIYLNPFIYIN